MKITVELSNAELCDVVRRHVLDEIGCANLAHGDVRVTVGERYYGNATARVEIDTDVPEEAPVAVAAE